MTNHNSLISFSILNCIINVTTESVYLRSTLLKVYGSMEVSPVAKNASLEYQVSITDDVKPLMTIARDGCSDLVASDIGEFIFFFEKDMTIELQRIRSDLLFIHSAALEYMGQGLLIVAPSGTGKSTTSWAMVNSGFRYLSDELAPINIQSMQVEAYPHALCLKAVPPIFELPDSCLHTAHTIHVPVNSIEDGAHLKSVKLKYIFYLEFDAEIIEPVIEPITAAEASAQLYTNSLNILAHDIGDNGLSAAISVAKKVDNYSLKSNHLDKTCEQIKLLMKAD